MTTKQVQLLLVYLGYAPGPMDGLDGPKTREAITAFQGDFGGIDVDGVAGKETWKALRNAVACGMDKPSAGSTSGTPPDNAGDYWSGIKYFSRDENGISCPCGRCGGFPVEPTETLMTTADSIREELGPMISSSTVRCKKHNDELPGSAQNSRHLYGKAMDFSCPKSTSAQIEACLARKKAAGEINYWYHMGSGWYHFDVD